MTMTPVSLGTISDVIPSSLPTPNIDYTSRDYQSMITDMINMIPTYLPEWTDRSPGDFGIVLMEEFAYMGDILNFYIDRIANEAFIATAQLLFQISNPCLNPVFIPGPGSTGGPTQVASPTPVINIAPGTTDAVVFETTSDLWIWGDGVVNPPIVYQSTGLVGQRIVLGDPTKAWPTYVFSQGNANQVVIVTPAGSTPGGAGDVQWTLAPNNSFVNQAGTATMFTVVSGGTDKYGNAILNTILFGDNNHGQVPPVNSTVTVTYSTTQLSLVAGSTPPSYAPASSYTGLVWAMHGQTSAGEGIGISDGTPNMAYTLYHTPVVDGSVDIYVDEGGGPVKWKYYQRIVDALSSTEAYTLNSDANGVVTVMFGDNISGRIPAVGALVTATYMVGGGVTGNVAANTLTQMQTGPPQVVSVTNPQAAAGGADAESTDHIRLHAPLSITAINRAVTLDDYAALTLNVPSVAKASAISTSYNAVDVYIHPTGNFFATGPNDTNGLQTLTNKVSALAPTITNSGYTGWLDDKKMVSTSIVVLPPQYNNNGVLSTGYVPCNVTATVQVLPQYHTSAVQNATISAIQNLFLFAVVDFGSKITLSSIYHALMNVPGVDYANVTVLARNEATQSVGDILCAGYEIPRAYQINVTANGGINY